VIVSEVLVKSNRVFVVTGVVVLAIALLVIGVLSARRSPPVTGPAAGSNPSQAPSAAAGTSVTINGTGATESAESGVGNGSRDSGRDPATSGKSAPSDSGTSGTAEGANSPGEADSRPVKGPKVTITFWNKTVSRPLGGTELVVGSSSFKPSTSSESSRGKLGPVPQDVVVNLIIYPDGRAGNKITVPLIRRSGATSIPGMEDVVVAIWDSEVRVGGRSILRSYGQEFPRF
jgi:hypothetical protein